MLVLSGLLMVMMMRSEAAELITARCGESVLLSSEGLKGAGLKLRQDIRWTHQHVLLSWKSNKTRCHHERCAMQSDGALLFTNVQLEDAGNYSMQVFDANGQRLMRKDFLLRVEGAGPSHGTSVLVCLVLLFLILPVLFMVFLFLRKRRGQRTTTTKGPMEDNVYVVMHGNHGNKKNKEEKQQDKEEESPYVIYMGTPITEQRTADEEDIYV